MAIRTGALSSQKIYRTCVTGAKMPPYICSLQWDDELTCYCKTDFCNSNKIFLSNFTSFPIIACKQVYNRKYRPVVCNKCLRIISYVKNRIGPGRSDDEEHIECSLQYDSADFVVDTNSFREELIARNFYVNACYNVSMHTQHYYVYCRCTQTDCNSPEVPIPYPLSPPTVSCYTSGFDAIVNPKKYEKPNTYFEDNYKILMSNDSYIDEESRCRGDFCFVATVPAETGENEMDVYYKGCISANEHGDNSIQLGYLYLNEIPYYICNTDYCNLNRELALKEAKNSTIKVVRSIDKTCITGIKKPLHKCSLDYADTMSCFCDSDFCNTPHLFFTNFTFLPIIECKQVVQKIYTAAACNNCVRIISYLKLDTYESSKFPNQNENLKDLEEEIGCSGSSNSGDFVIDSRIYMPERMLRNFFTKACYNLSLHREHYYTHCRCLEPNCNTPETTSLPYPISAPRIKCYTSGFDDEVNNRKYEKANTYYRDNYKVLMTNETFVDDESECQGHYCFISIFGTYLVGEPVNVYYKGCISANEQGDHKLSLGYSYLNDLPYYICNTDYCNVDVETVLAEAKNASQTVLDNLSYKNLNFTYWVFIFLIGLRL